MQSAELDEINRYLKKSPHKKSAESPKQILRNKMTESPRKKLSIVQKILKPKDKPNTGRTKGPLNTLSRKKKVDDKNEIIKF